MTNPTPPHGGRAFFLESVLFAVLILGPSVAVAVALDYQHGDLATWATAIATIAAFTAAVAAARYAKQAFELETKRDERWRDDQRQKQASQVAAWVRRLELETHTDDHGRTTVTIPRGQSFSTINTSGLPVVDPVYEFQVRVRRSTTFILDLGTHGEVLLVPSDGPQELPLPEKVRLRLGEVATDNVDQKTSEVPPMTITVGVTFTDTANRHWIRAPNGRLSLAPEDLVERRNRESSL